MAKNPNLKDGSKNRGPNYEKNKKKAETQVETLEIREAFEYYYGLGETRSLKAVSEFTGKAPLTVKRWSSRFNWVQKVKDRDKQNGEKLQIATDAAIVATKATYREAIGQLMRKAIEDIQSGRIQVRSVKDLDMIARLDLDLMAASGGDQIDNTNSLADIIKQSWEMANSKSESELIDELPADPDSIDPNLLN